jgi:hypothetical protein
MPASRASAFAFALIVAGLGPAAAQTGPPVRLGPPQRLTPAPPAPETHGPGTERPATDSAASGIQVAPLAALDPDWAGPLGPGEGGFEPGLWQGTPRALILELAPRLPVTTSPTLQSLERRLLLSNAQPAPGDGGGFLGIRVDRLLAMGAVDEAQALLAVGPRRDSEAAERAAIELKLLAGDRDGACRDIGEGMRRRQGVWWERALVACQALAGQRDQAALGLGLLREQKAPPDPAFDTLVEAVGGRQAKLASLPDASPLHLALLQAAKQPFPGDLATVKHPATLRTLASAEGVSPAQRLAAAQRAAAFGALPLDELRALYDAVESTAEERASSISKAVADKGPRGRALLWQAAKAQPNPAARAELLGKLLEQARTSGDYLLAARTVEPLLSELRLSPELADHAGIAARALYAAGRAPDARAWLALADGETQRELLPLAQLAQAGDAPRPEPGALRAWVEAKQKRDAEAGTRAATLVLGLMEALGETVPPDAWVPILGNPAVAPAAVSTAAPMLALPGAVAGKRLGETLLLALPLLAEGDRLTASSVALARGVEALRLAGLEADARALAVEATLAAGL